jgi:hypothetical protein
MRAHFRAFFDHAYVDIVAVLRGQLFKTNRSRKTRRSRTDNDYVVLHRFAIRHRGSLFTRGV